MKEIYYDELTGVYNRKFLHYWIENEIKRANRFATKFSLIMLDLDNFRDINNSFGHLEGDKVLIGFAKFLQNKVREVDNLVRYGGDEFIILMPSTNTKGVLELAQRIVSGLNGNKIIDHEVLCSIGFAVFPDDGSTLETLINQADNLLYQAKKQGKNRIGLKPEISKKLVIPSPVTIGREKETDWCLNQLKENNTIFIAGEAGIGKTRLAYEVSARLNNPILLRGNAYAALSMVPYHPFKNLFGELLKQKPELAAAALARLPEAYRIEVMKFYPDERTTAVTAVEILDHFRLYNSLSRFFHELAEAAAPGVIQLLIDDLHWADQSTCQLFDFLIRSIRDRVLIFATYRIEEIRNSAVGGLLGVWAREKLFTQIRLSPLNESQCAQLLEMIMGTVSPAMVKFMYHESGGNPFYLEELLRELERQRKIFWNGREWVLQKDQELSIPPSIEETISRKLRFLNPEVKAVLLVMAVYGQEFSPDLIALATHRNAGEILDAIDDLIRSGFIKERTPDTYFFSEDIVRQIVYKMISRADLVRYHQAVGEAIEIYFSTTLASFSEQLAQHFMTGQIINKALRYAKQAAQKAKENYAFASAVHFYDIALKYEDRIDEIFKLKSSVAEIHALTGQHQSAIKNYQDCLAINPNAYLIYNELGRVYEQRSDYKKSLEYLRLGLKKTAGTEAAFLFRSTIAWIHTRHGQYAIAQKECEDMLRHRKNLNHSVIASLLVTMGVVALNRGDFNRAKDNFTESLRIRQSLGEKRRMPACYLDLAIAYQNRLDLATAEELYQNALRLYEEIGLQEGIAIALLDLGSLYNNFDLLKAEEYYLRGLTIAKLIGSKRNLIYLYNNLGYINYCRLVEDASLNQYKQALAITKEIGFREGLIFTNLNLSELYRGIGQVKKGRIHFQAANRLAAQVNMKYYTQSCRLEEINYLLTTRSYQRADRLSRQLLQQMSAERDLNYKFYWLMARGKVLRHRKRYAAAHAAFEQAGAIVKHLPSTVMTGEVRFERALTMKQEGHLARANKLLLEAFRIFEKTAHLRFMARIEEEMARVNISEKSRTKNK